MIEVGEYIRLKTGTIDKVRKIRDNKIFISHLCGYSKNEIKKHSKNIIDLIEVGDYVNGLEVYKGKVASGKEKLLVGNHIVNGMALEVVNIKSILTKEQYNQSCYRLEEIC